MSSPKGQDDYLKNYLKGIYRQIYTVAIQTLPEEKAQPFDEAKMNAAFKNFMNSIQTYDQTLKASKITEPKPKAISNKCTFIVTTKTGISKQCSKNIKVDGHRYCPEHEQHIAAQNPTSYLRAKCGSDQFAVRVVNLISLLTHNKGEKVKINNFLASSGTGKELNLVKSITESMHALVFSYVSPTGWKHGCVGVLKLNQEDKTLNYSLKKEDLDIVFKYHGIPQYNEANANQALENMDKVLNYITFDIDNGIVVKT